VGDPQGFSHFWPIALAFLHVHARACLHMLRRLVRCLAPLVSRQSRLGTLVFPARSQNQSLTKCAEIKADESMLLCLMYWSDGTQSLAC